jgi:molybdopterin molybdotransferase
MIGFEEAIALVRAVARPLGTERISIGQAAGRVLAGPVTAQIDSPRSDVSAMDGYAARENDLGPFPLALKIVGESYPGSPWKGHVGSGECVRIFTGAPVPNGADRIVIQEDVVPAAGVAKVAEKPGPARFIRSRGSDFNACQQLLPQGRLLNPQALVAAAAADVAILDVYRQPRLHIFSTGDELVDPGDAAKTANAVPDSASLGVAALAEQWGIGSVGRTRLRDDLDAMVPAARDAVANNDVVVVTGGASVGEKDFAKAMFAPCGLELLFSTIAMKPGKPVWLGRIGTSLVVGLPGNPTSALVTARLLLAPLLAGLGGRPVDAALAWAETRLSTPLPACGARETFHRAQLVDGAAHILPFQDSHAQKALADADLLVRQPANSPAIAQGETVQTLKF